MFKWTLRATAICGVSVLTTTSLAAQDDVPMAADAMAEHDMWSASLGGGWWAMGMAQLFPVVTFGAPALDDSPLSYTGWYLTQPAAMVNLEAPGQRVTLRTTFNLEGITIENGEQSFGGWGEGFIDKRHPHTLLHELMLSVNFWGIGGGDLSLSAGKGFAPYGTDDPMSRPGLKYPTNHHLSQVLERWTVNALYLRGGWSLEAGIFGGREPEGAYDFSNIDSFGDSWAARLSRRWGAGTGPGSEWEISGSHAHVVEKHHIGEEATHLSNAVVRYARPDGGVVEQALVEASVGRQHDGDDFFSVLGEVRFDRSGHQPYLRLEYASRPEYERRLDSGGAFFRYEHDEEPMGSTRWLIGTVGYAYELSGAPFSVRPFVELQRFNVRSDRGGIEPVDLFGSERFWGVSMGARVFLGGGPMRMGAYGALDPMTSMGRMEGMDGM